MLFNSYIFLFLFLPLCLAGFYLLERAGKKEAARIWLIGFSFWFYGYFNLSYLWIMLISIGFNYLVYRILLRGRRMRAVLSLGVAGNLGLLFYFKYYDFFLENINALFRTRLPLQHILLPLGISFFTFQQIGFLTDVYRETIQGKRERVTGPVSYALFVSFFPQLIAGPIVNREEMLPQFDRIGSRSFSWETFARGVYLFGLGMGKKVLLADTLAKPVNFGYENLSALNGTDAVLVMLFYTFQLYFDFSGYCDMARGLGMLFGIRIPENFRSPYRSSSIVMFWKRWHITLNRFLTQNVYIPLGGSRKGKTRMYVNLLLVFLISGLWHGAGWNYVVWGLVQGILYVLTRMWQQRKGAKKDAPPHRARQVLATAGTFFLVNVSMVLFRSPTLHDAGLLFSRMATGGMAAPSPGIYEGFRLPEFWYVIKVLGLDRLPGSGMYLCVAFLAFSFWAVFAAKDAETKTARFTPRAWNMLGTALLYGWCILSLSGVSTFLYFNF